MRRGRNEEKQRKGEAANSGCLFDPFPYTNQLDCAMKSSAFSDHFSTSCTKLPPRNSSRPILFHLYQKPDSIWSNFVKIDADDFESAPVTICCSCNLHCKSPSPKDLS
ncbi:hypothetical protein D8674_039674 [Pyrus ussuriensis x Pyrus communis]|uniref:Uncharacterized protein n=1 Tax=Pyrus ussuriensis x Pyrus communis TaxID=2448454 RepID=A0A5N5GA57_9ROSA|nr:hypothetical protein D8674_039674 [Pyrus ussuriensis x Pyrus communis]